jgi:hypothetical protein
LQTPAAKEELLSVNSETESYSTNVWSKKDCWYANSFFSLFNDALVLIDKEQVVIPAFIDSALSDCMGVADAVNSLFSGTDIFIGVKHHADGITGLVDIDIKGIGSVSRVVIDVNIKRGDMFNVYFDEDSKGGAFWDNDLVTSLSNFFGVYHIPPQ